MKRRHTEAFLEQQVKLEFNSSISENARSFTERQAQFTDEYRDCLSKIPGDIYQKLRTLRKSNPQLFERLELLFDTSYNFSDIDDNTKYIKLYLSYREKRSESESEKADLILRTIKFVRPQLSNILEHLTDTTYNLGDVTNETQFTSDYIALNLEISPDIAQTLRNLRKRDLELFEQLENQEHLAETAETSSISDQLVHGSIHSISKINSPLAQELQAQSKGNTSETHSDRVLDKQKECIKKTSAFEEIAFGECTRAKNNPNQDTYFTNSKYRVFAVFDGVGRTKNAHIASKGASEYIQGQLDELSDKIGSEGLQACMNDILVNANKKVRSLENGKTAGSIVKIMADGTVVIGNVADTRVYLLRDGEQTLNHLTHDRGYPANKYKKEWRIQKVVADLDTFDNVSYEHRKYIENRHRIHTALGIQNNRFLPAIYVEKVKCGDWLILTTDGIHDNLTDSKIVECLLAKANSSQDAASALKDAAEAKMKECVPGKPGLQRAKIDDATVVVIKFI